ncbi:LAQU0S05e04698g1_1 [Lachancea quebecensis]|uniref:LAQU0S05e04698g1_1 n=1 Tax=Lachancea quebecensis TaxID=1654605 RepID=A0A0P1KRU5_9SACH|nr:LAQU0S05e04698g1_1 [Lachancea quebecensis]
MRRNASKKHVPVTEEDFYVDATSKEEQAERWALSDVKKTIGHYMAAFNAYEQGLNAMDCTEVGSYHIYYNQTRLLLKLHTDYIACDGINILQYVNISDLGDGINILQYANTTDLGNTSPLFLPLDSIIDRFEFAIAKFGDLCSWDLFFNLLTCYLSFLEESSSELGGEILLKIFSRFVELAQNLIQLHLQELETWDVSIEAKDDDFRSMDLSHQSFDSTTGEGIKASQDAPAAEYVEMQDEITHLTFVETLTVCFRFVSTLMEILFEAAHGKRAGINPVQSNYLRDAVSQFKSQLNSFASEIDRDKENSETIELDLAIRFVQGLELAMSANFDNLQRFIEESGDDSDNLMICVDVLRSCLSNQSLTSLQNWSFCSEIGRLLSRVETGLTQKRLDIMSGRLKGIDNELSPTVFKLCDVMITRSDNELLRWSMKMSEPNNSLDQSASKTSAVLLKNAEVLLKNATAIAQKPCGFREYVTDKLKRNYIYKQAYERLEFIKSGKTTAVTKELALDHPFFASR